MRDNLVRIGTPIVGEAVDGLLCDHTWYLQTWNGLVWLSG